MPRSLQMVLITSLDRFTPWSLWRTHGTPYRDMNWSTSTFARVIEVVHEGGKPIL